MVATSLNEKYAMDYSQGWKESVLTGFSANLLEADQTIGYCVNAIQDYAYSGFQCRGGGKHGDIFWPEEAYAIKKVIRHLPKYSRPHFGKSALGLYGWLTNWRSSMTGNCTVPTRKSRTLQMEGMTVKSEKLRTAMVEECRDNGPWGVYIRAP